MTRGEALLAMEGGARVRQVWEHPCLQLVFFIKDDNLMSTDVFANSLEDAFLGCLSYELLPEPDTAEKFVREFNATCPSGPLPDYWETFIQKFFKRSNDLIQQMDGEK